MSMLDGIISSPESNFSNETALAGAVFNQDVNKLVYHQSTSEEEEEDDEGLFFLNLANSVEPISLDEDIANSEVTLYPHQAYQAISNEAHGYLEPPNDGPWTPYAQGQYRPDEASTAYLPTAPRTCYSSQQVERTDFYSSSYLRTPDLASVSSQSTAPPPLTPSSQGPGRYPCGECGREFDKSNDWKRHEDTHSPDGPHFICKCKYQSKRKDNYKRHVSRCERTEFYRNYSCKCLAMHSTKAVHLGHVENCRDCYYGNAGRPAGNSRFSG